MNINRRLINQSINKRILLLIAVAAGFLGGLLTIAQARNMSITISRVFIDNQTLVDVGYLLRLLLAIIIGRGFLVWGGEVSAKAFASQIKVDLRQMLYNHVQNLGPAFTKGERTGELTTAAVEGIEALDAYFSQYLPQVLLSAIIPISILIYIFPFDPISAVILLVTAPLIPVFMVLIGKGAEKLTNRQYETLSRLSAHFLDSLQGLKTLKMLGQSRNHADSIAETSNQFREATMRVLRVTFLSALTLELLATLSTAVIAVEVGLRLLYARMSFEEAFTLLILAPEFYIPLRTLGLRFHAGMNGIAAAKKIFAILDIPSRRKYPVLPVEFGTSPHFQAPEIRLDQVSFSYTAEDGPALEKINLTIKPGESLVLVGRSGAGKSTLVSLLLGFLQPNDGRILIDGKDLEEVPPVRWQELIAWVPQDPFIFNDTIANNIRIGKPGADMEEIIQAARNAHLHAFVEILPSGYQTMVGEAGARLSSGQIQRLALARAFISKAPILILDEPTTHLDPILESQLEDSTRKLMRESASPRTVITIAHRINTAIRADKVAVLKTGKIVELGTHPELIKANGEYANIFLPQSEVGIDVVNDKRLVEELDYERDQLRLEEIPPVEPETPPQPTGKILSRLLGFLDGSFVESTLSVIAGSATILSSVGLIGTSAWLISAAALHPSIAELQVAIVGVRFLGISRGVFRYLERLVSHDLTFRILSRMRTWFYQAVEPLAPARLLGYHSGELLNRIVADIDSLEDFFIRVIYPSITAVIVSGISAVFLAFYDVYIGLALVIFHGIVGVLIPLLTQRISLKPGKELVNLRGELRAKLVDGIQGAADLRVFNRDQYQGDQIMATAQKIFSLEGVLSNISGSHGALSLMITNLGALVILILGIRAVVESQISGVMLGAIALIALVSFEAVQPLPLAAQKLGEIIQAARRLFELADLQPEVDEQPGKREVGELRGPVIFNNLTFTYPGRVEPALKHINLKLEVGRTYAIVGPSGAGKSTLLNLLLRFWEYHYGEILVGGRSLQEYDPVGLHSKIAVVPQQPYFFNANILDNLTLAKPGSNEDQINESVRLANIYDFISTLPQGYETFIGEQGARLSGGERQRLGIARALVMDAPILVLDEPIANLDPVSQKYVMQSILGLKGTKTRQGIQRTIVLITHWFLCLDQIDEIFVLDNGKVVEHGTQANLLSRGGYYAYMYALQNRIIEV